MNLQLTHEEIKKTAIDKEIILIAENLQLPANYGGLIRTAEFFGVKRLIFISEENKELSSKMKRVSRSAENNIEIKFSDRVEDIISEYKSQKYKIIALELTSNSIAINNYSSQNDKILLIVGNEKIGVTQQTLDLVDDTVKIPVIGTTSSLNVVVATGIALNHLNFD